MRLAALAVPLLACVVAQSAAAATSVMPLDEIEPGQRGTARTVFEGDTPVKVAFAHATKEPLPLSAWDEVSIPGSLEALVMTCLAKDPDDRPRDALDLYERLGACDDVETWSAEAAERWWRLHDPSVIQHF